MVLARIARLAESGNIQLDPQALKILEAYLDSYSFPIDRHGAEIELLKRMGQNAHFAWPIVALREFHADPLRARIGIPQAERCLKSWSTRFSIPPTQPWSNFARKVMICSICGTAMTLIILSPSQSVAAQAFQIYLDQFAIPQIARS